MPKLEIVQQADFMLVYIDDFPSGVRCQVPGPIARLAYGPSVIFD